MWARASMAVAAGSVGGASVGGSLAVAEGSGVLVGGAGVVVGMGRALVKASVGGGVALAGALFGRASEIAPRVMKLRPMTASSAMPTTISQLGRRAAGGVVIGGRAASLVDGYGDGDRERFPVAGVEAGIEF